MTTYQQLQELCYKAQEYLNRGIEGKTPVKINIFSGLKPNNYFLPTAHFGTSKTITDEIRMAYFVEVYVDGRCIVRDSHVPHNNESLEIIKDMLSLRIIVGAFTSGLWGYKKQLDNLNTLQ